MLIHENFISQRITKRRVSNVKSNKQSLFENVRLIQTSTKCKKSFGKKCFRQVFSTNRFMSEQKKQKTKHCETYF